MNSREKMLIGMNEIVRSLNNEDAIDSWLMCGVSDGADEEEIKAMANDDNDFVYCASLFLDIMRYKSAWEDGIYDSKTEKVYTADSRKES